MVINITVFIFQHDHFETLKKKKTNEISANKVKKKYQKLKASWCTPAIPALRSPQQEESLHYMATFCL